MNIALWIIQSLVAALFLFAGGMKLVMPLDEMVAQSGLPGALILFLGVCEVLGGLGLILPGALRIKTGLTPLAAAGLTIIMIGATVLTAAGVGGGDAVLATIPLTIGLLTAFVAYGRSRIRPHGQRTRSTQTRAAVEAAA